MVGSSRLLCDLVDASTLEQMMCGVSQPPDVDAIQDSARVEGWDGPGGAEYAHTLYPAACYVTYSYVYICI